MNKLVVYHKYLITCASILIRPGQTHIKIIRSVVGAGLGPARPFGLACAAWAVGFGFGAKWAKLKPDPTR